MHKWLFIVITLSQKGFSRVKSNNMNSVICDAYASSYFFPLGLIKPTEVTWTSFEEQGSNPAYQYKPISQNYVSKRF